MKSRVFSIGVTFLVLGFALGAWGFVGLVPSPTQIGMGGAMAATGLGLMFHVRLAYHLGLALSTAATGLGGWKLYRALEDAHHVGIVKAGIMLAIGLYLLVALALQRAQFRRQPK
jgi:hypothetical protein